ncbi:uridine kinase family protein [Neglectibacter caecimuris]|uniref:uridine kinase family protein n=1 Tax=Neglectibacter caecimuris TaxID=3093658 RepID=UPI002AC8BFFA|nr:nucleoside kinase [Neglectibacter sp. M00184]
MSNFASGYMKYINHLEQINEGAVTCPQKMINEVEDAYHEHLKNIARNIREQHRQVRVVMLAGPSSSGKTTTAHLLRAYLSEFGGKAHIISLDDFYLGSGLAPILPNGKYDYESVEALNVEKIRACLKAVTSTGRFSVPRYNFTLGRPEAEERQYEISPTDVVIVEGIHGLNPIFTGELSPEVCVKLYVSVKQQIKDANGEVISPMDLRLVRRIVRDIQFRSTTAEHTISMWPEVVSGEDKYIRPYRISADYTVNSIHIYEPCVLRTVAIPLLREIAADSPYYRKARDLESRLMRFEPVDAALVPKASMLREFLG